MAKIKLKSDTHKMLHLDAVFVKSGHVDDDEEKDLIIEGFANTTDKDRAGDVIVQDAWTSKSALPNYLKNPIILAFHDHSKPIGIMIDHEVTSKGLRIQAKISKAAGGVYDLIKDGILQAFSVGFRVLEADYDSTTDIFVIKDLELHEISVVSVPCNQESVFQVSKSFDSDAEFANFKSLYTKQTESEAEAARKALEEESNHHNENDNNEEFSMDPKELEALIAKSVLAATEKAEKERIAIAQAEKDALARAADEETRVAAIVKSNTESLVADLEAKMKQSAEAFAEKLVEVQGDVAAKSEEIAAIIAARGNKMNFSETADKSVFSKTELENAFILAKVCKKGIFDTKMGQAMAKAVNTSSSGQVSSDKYEQEVTLGLFEDMKEMLTVQPLFREIALTSATQVLPLNPNATSAAWVNPSAYGTDASTAPELTKALTEIILQTFKLAGKSYITDETEEDAIIPILPLLRDQLVEAHANEVDNALINGINAANDPTGLIKRALDAGGIKVNTTTAKADGTVKVTAKMLLQTRRGLGQWGLDLNKVNVIVSLDAYWDLLEDDEFSNINEVGAIAQKKTGQVGAVYGMPVMISTQMPAKAVSKAFAILVHSGNFIVPRLRGFSIQSDYDVEKQRRVIVSTQRLGFNDIIADEGVVIATYAAA